MPIGRPLRILVVDDEPGARAALRFVLRRDNHHTSFASSADEALQLIENAAEPFDLIISDHVMPGMSGFDFVRKLKERKFAGELFILTAHADAETVAEYRTTDIAGLMAKPFDIADIRQWVVCLQGCRQRPLETRTGPRCAPGAKDFCWLRPEDKNKSNPGAPAAGIL
jgi:CheY-like chemotaxis protein